jgi:TP901 family phage tail tape measure protein
MRDSFMLKAIITGVDKLSPTLFKIDKNVDDTAKRARGRRRKETEEERIINARVAAAAERSKRYRDMDRNIGGMALTATAGLTAAGIAFARQEEAGVSLQTSMMKKGGLVDASYDKINQKAIELGSRLPGSTADFQNMMETLVSQGITAESILSGVGEAAANLAVQLKMPPTQAALAMAEYQDATGATGEQLLRLADSAQRAYYMGVKLEDSVQFFSKVRPALKMIAKDGAEASEALQPISVALQQAAMDSSSAGNAMNKIFQAPLDKKKLNKVNKSLARKGLKFDFFDKNGNFKGVDNFIVQLEKMKKLNSFQQKWVKQTLWGNDSETDTALSVLSDMGLEGYQKIQKKMSEQASLNERVGSSLGTVTNQFDAMKGSAENAAGALGKSFEPQMKYSAEKLDSFANKLNTFADKNPKAVQSITNTAVAVTGMAIAIRAVNAAMAILSLNPLTLSIVGIAAAAGYLVAHSDELQAIVDKNKVESPTAKEAKKVTEAYGFGKKVEDKKVEQDALGFNKPRYMPRVGIIPAGGTNSVDLTAWKLAGKLNDLIYDMGAMEGQFPQAITSWQQAPAYQYGPKQGFLEGGINQLRGQLEVKFENAPEGMSISQAKTNIPGFDVKADVGFSPFRRQ